MKKLLIILGIIVGTVQPVMAEEPPAGVVKFRKILEDVRVDIHTYNLRLRHLVKDGGWTKQDQDYLTSHITHEDALSIGKSLDQSLSTISKEIVILGGSQNLSEKEVIGIIKSISKEFVNEDR